MRTGQIWQRNLAILCTLLSILGFIGFLVIVGLDLLRNYEASGMLAGFIAVTLTMGIPALMSIFFWVLYCRKGFSNYETI